MTLLLFEENRNNNDFMVLRTNFDNVFVHAIISLFCFVVLKTFSVLIGCWRDNLTDIETESKDRQL